MSAARREAKLEARVQALRRDVQGLQDRLDARLVQVVYLIDQIESLKAALSEHGIEISFVETPPTPEEPTLQSAPSATSIHQNDNPQDPP